MKSRYFSETNYKFAQQRWYNKHIRFLHAHFETIIRDRITSVFNANKRVESIFKEPVDLLWLTGKKYNRLINNN